MSARTSMTRWRSSWAGPPCVFDTIGQTCAAEKGGVGFVPAENLEGRAEFLFFSTNGTARLWEFWRWPFAIRYDRLFGGVH